MPMPGDPSFARDERRARAREAAAAATPERIEELRARYEPTEPIRPRPAPRSSTRSKASSTRSRADEVVDAAAIAEIARTGLGAHPGTWTSHAELCSAAGLDRQRALVVARHLTPGRTGELWFRVRNGEGVFIVPTDGAERGDPARYNAEEADRLLRAIGVDVAGGRADRRKKLVWTAAGWRLQH